MCYCYIDIDGYEVCECSAWHDWGRWLLLGLCLGIPFLSTLAFCVFACVNANKHHRAGQKPRKGTAWTLGITPKGHTSRTYHGPPTNKDIELSATAQPPNAKYANGTYPNANHFNENDINGAYTNGNAADGSYMYTNRNPTEQGQDQASYDEAHRPDHSQTTAKASRRQRLERKFMERYSPWCLAGAEH